MGFLDGFNVAPSFGFSAPGKPKAGASFTTTLGASMSEAYCVKCKCKQEMVDPKQVKMKNGKPATKGTCPECGTGMYKIGKK